jgi:hypothetical protein
MSQARFAADSSETSLRLYRIGAVSVVLFTLTGIIAPMIILNSLPYDAELAGQDLIEHIGAHRLWWIALQNLTMGSMIFVIPPLIALYPALKAADGAVALIGIVLAISCQVLFMAYFPVVNGLTWIADRYAETTDPAHRAALIGGAEALVAQNNAYGTSDGIFAASIGVISWAMRRSVFDRVTIGAGFLAASLGIVMAFFKPWLGIHYLWWWLFQVIWFFGIGWRFYRLGWRKARATAG